MPEATNGKSMGADGSRKEPRERFPSNVLDELIKGATGPGKLATAEDIQGLLRELSGALVNRAMEAEMSHHLGYEREQKPTEGQSNRRNSVTGKQVRTQHGAIQVNVPRDREGSFEPQLVAKHQRDFAGFDDKILAMYARGMTVRDICPTGRGQGQGGRAPSSRTPAAGGSARRR